jgi:hypothetical protein
LLALLFLARLILVIGGAATVGLTLAVGLRASKRTSQIATTRIVSVGEKENPAVPTARQAPAQLRLGPQNRAQQHVIPEDQFGHDPALIPILGKLKMLPDLDCQNPSTWLWTLKLVKAPLVLPERRQAVEAGQGDFYRRPNPSDFVLLGKKILILRPMDPFAAAEAGPFSSALTIKAFTDAFNPILSEYLLHVGRSNRLDRLHQRRIWIGSAASATSQNPHVFP